MRGSWLRRYSFCPGVQNRLSRRRRLRPARTGSRASTPGARSTRPDYRRDWATIAGLHFLEPGTHSLGSDKKNAIVLPADLPANVGQIVVADGWVRYEPAPGVTPSQNGKPVTGTVVLKEPGKDAADEVAVADVKFAVHESGPRLSLRVWDPDGKQAKEFAGFDWFPIDPNYRVVARFIPDEKPTSIPVMNTYNDVDVDAVRRRRGVHAERRDRAAAPVHDAAEAFLLRLPRRLERPRDLRNGSFPVFRSPGRRDNSAGFQRGVQPALRVQQVHDVSDSAQGEPPGSEDSRGREGVRGARVRREMQNAKFRMQNRVRSSWSALASSSVARSRAHHGDAGRYDEEVITVTGTVVAVQMVNPHSHIIFDVVKGGKTVRWQGGARARRSS